MIKSFSFSLLVKFSEDLVKVLVLMSVLLSLSSCTHLFFQPAKRHYLNPAQLKLTYDDVFFKSKDGTKLHGWFFPSKQKDVKGTVIQFHGNAQNLSTHFLSLIWMIDHGYNLFVWDYRGYGKSEGEADQEGVYLDALAALEKGRELQKAKGGGHYVAYGQSLGGAVLLRALPDYAHKDEVTFLVQDSTFSSYKDIAFNRVSSVWFMLPISPLAYVLISDEYASEDVFDQISWPTLVVVGQKDDVIPQKFGKEIFKEIATEQKWLWKIPEGAHIDVFHVDKGKYREPFLQLLEQTKR